MYKVDILVLAAHPDDAELGCGATLAKHVAAGKTVAIVDLTRGELGTRGTPEIRDEEAKAAAAVLGVMARENLFLRDGFFQNDPSHQMDVIRMIRKYKPEIVLANAVSDRHSDHGKAAELSADACFLSGLQKIKTHDAQGKEQDAWRPKAIYHFIQSNYLVPDFIVDVSDHWETKMKAITSYRSQFFDPEKVEPETFISKPGFMKMIEARGVELGHSIGVTYGEGFNVRRTPGVNSLFHLQ